MTLPSNIQSSFDAAAKTLIEMKQEIATLEKKYGAESDLVLRKRRSLQVMIDFYKTMGDAVPKLYSAMRLAALNQETLYLMESKRMLGVSWDVAKEILGIPPEKIKDLKTIDDILARIMMPITA